MHIVHTHTYEMKFHSLLTLSQKFTTISVVEFFCCFLLFVLVFFVAGFVVHFGLFKPHSISIREKCAPRILTPGHIRHLMLMLIMLMLMVMLIYGHAN